MELHDLTAVEQASGIRRREISSIELLEHYLRRIDSLNEAVGAFAVIDEPGARAQAAQADSAVSQADSLLPVLHGVTVPVKDLNLTAGVRTRFGTSVMDLVPDVDDDVVVRLREGGTVMTGKTTTPEFGFPCYTESDIGPYARTPWDLARGAGGSSGGAAAAVSAGLAAVAQGSDGGGSVRIPASCCGLVGLKPSRGLISNGPLPDGPGGLVVQGALARTVADAAALLGVMTGTNDGYLRAIAPEVPSLVVGCYSAPVIADTVPDPQVLVAWRKVTQLLESLGHRVIEVEVPLALSDVPHFERVWSAAAAGIPLTEQQVEGLRPLTRWLRERGEALTEQEIAEAVALMNRAASAALRASQGVDVIVTPTLAQVPALVGALRDDDDPAGDFEAQKAFTPYTSPYNMTGQPAITLPVHWTDDDLPVGVQLIGRPLQEAQLLSVAAQVEAALPWIQRHPEIW